MGLHELKPARGARTQKRRVGRGDAARRGSTAGRGRKGQNARGNIHPLFEGGQLPLAKRLPYMRGFKNRFRTEYVPVNLDRLVSFSAENEVTPATLFSAGIIDSVKHPVKILGNGDLKQPLMISAHAFSKSAREKIERAGGAASVIETKQPASKD